jgi:polar amino acid transport system substrate-binding protein
MKRQSRLRAAIWVAIGLCFALGSGCARSTGNDVQRAEQPTPQARFDQSLHDLLPSSVRQRGTLRVGTDASYAPMSSFGPDGRTIVGMEPELAQAMGRVLGIRVRFVHADFTRILPSVEDGSLDLGLSAMTDTAERAKRVDFVNYFSAGTAIVVQRGNPAGISTIQGLCGRVVAVEAGTTQVDLLRRAQGNCAGTRINVKTYATNSDALLQLRTGRAVAVLNDLPPAVFLVNDPRTRSHFQLASTTQYEPGLYGIAVAKHQRTLRDAIEGALEVLVKSGDYRSVLRHWKVGDGAVDQISVNSDR